MKKIDYQVDFENNSETPDIYRHPIWILTLYIIAYSLIIFFIGLIGNVVVILVILLNKILQSSTNFYIVNLAVADLLVIICCIPPTVMSHIYIPWYLGWFLCKSVAYVQGLSICASVYSLVAISVDRFLAIWSPRPSRNEGEKGFVKYTITLIWIFSGGLMLPWAFYFNTTNEIEGQDPNSEFCLEIWPGHLNGNLFYLVINLFLGYIIPLIIIFVCYFCIWIRVWKRYVPTTPNYTSTVESESFTKSQSSQIKILHQRAKVNVLKLVIILVLVFALSWLPLYITFTYLKFTDELSESELTFFTIVTPISQWLSTSSSAVNPCLYGFINKKFRKVLSTKIQKLRNNTTNNSSSKVVHIELENMSNGNAFIGRIGGRRNRRQNDPGVRDTFV